MMPVLFSSPKDAELYPENGSLRFVIKHISYEKKAKEHQIVMICNNILCLNASRKKLKRVFKTSS